MSWLKVVKSVRLVKSARLVNVHFFYIWMSKKAQNRQFYTFDLDMCFAPTTDGVHFFDIWTSKSGPNPSVFGTFDLEMCFAPQTRSLFQHLNFQKWSGAGVLCTFGIGHVLRATTDGVHFFDIWTSKSGPNPSVFGTFDLEMCFAPQTRSLFQHLNFQKWSGAGVLCTFWIGNVIRATTATLHTLHSALYTLH